MFLTNRYERQFFVAAKDAKPKKPRAKKPPKPKVDRTDPNRKLIPNQAVTVWEKDPLFESK